MLLVTTRTCKGVEEREDLEERSSTILLYSISQVQWRNGFVCEGPRSLFEDPNIDTFPSSTMHLKLHNPFHPHCSAACYLLCSLINLSALSIPPPGWKGLQVMRIERKNREKLEVRLTMSRANFRKVHASASSQYPHNMEAFSGIQGESCSPIDCFRLQTAIIRFRILILDCTQESGVLC